MSRSAIRRSAGRAPFLLGILLICWVVLAEVVVPSLARPALQRQGARAMEVLAPLATQRNALEYWPSYSRTVTAVLALVWVLSLLATWQPFQEYVTRRQGATAADAPSRMGRARLYVVQGLIGVIVGGSLLATLSGVELWPFSPYKMYSQLEVGTTSRWRLLGTSGDGKIDLSRIPDLTPFDASRLFWAMLRVEHGGERDRVLDSIARYVWRRYEGERATGGVRGPALQSIRLYRFTWLTDEPRIKVRPDTTQLMYEWVVPR